MSILTLGREIFIEARKRSLEHQRRQQRKRIAKVFNDTYTYGERYLGKEYAWMCPGCNTVHLAAPERSAFTGLQFPSCCAYPEGHRLNEGIDLH